MSSAHHSSFGTYAVALDLLVLLEISKVIASIQKESQKNRCLQNQTAVVSHHCSWGIGYSSNSQSLAAVLGGSYCCPIPSSELVCHPDQSTLSWLQSLIFLPVLLVSVSNHWLAFFLTDSQVLTLTLLIASWFWLFNVGSILASWPVPDHSFGILILSRSWSPNSVLTHKLWIWIPDSETTY